MQQATPPIIVSGAPRSGTTFAQELLSCHSRICIHGQSGLWGDVWSWYQKLAEEGRKAAIDNAAVHMTVHFGGSDDARCREIIGRLWRDFLAGRDDDRPRWGWRSPWTCANPDQVAEIESFWPDTRWIVCLREPFRAWQSQRATYSHQLPLDESIRRWTAVVHFAQQADPKRVTILQLDRLTAATAAERERHIARLFDGIAEPIEPAVTQFIRNWPTVHHLPMHTPLAQEDRDETLALFPDLPELMQSVGYATP